MSVVADRMTNVRAATPTRVMCPWCLGAGRILEPWAGFATLTWVLCEGCDGEGWT